MDDAASNSMTNIAGKGFLLSYTHTKHSLGESEYRLSVSKAPYWVQVTELVEEAAGSTKEFDF